MVKKKFLITETNFRYKFKTATAGDAIRAWVKKTFVKGSRATKPDRKGVFKVHCPAGKTAPKMKIVATVTEVKKPKPMKKPTSPIPMCEHWCAAQPLRQVIAWPANGKPRVWTRFGQARRAARLLAERYGGKYCYWADWSKRNPRYGIAVLSLPEEV